MGGWLPLSFDDCHCAVRLLSLHTESSCRAVVIAAHDNKTTQHNVKPHAIVGSSFVCRPQFSRSQGHHADDNMVVLQEVPSSRQLH